MLESVQREEVRIQTIEPQQKLPTSQFSYFVHPSWQSVCSNIPTPHTVQSSMRRKLLSVCTIHSPLLITALINPYCAREEGARGRGAWEGPLLA